MYSIIDLNFKNQKLEDEDMGHVGHMGHGSNCGALGFLLQWHSLDDPFIPISEARHVAESLGVARREVPKQVKLKLLSPRRNANT